MSRKLVLLTVLTVLLIDMLGAMFRVHEVKAGGTIYIRATGEVEGTDKIHRDGDVYTLTGNIDDSIIVEKDNIVVEGAGYMLQGKGAEDSKGITLTARSNVEIRNLTVMAFFNGIYLSHSFGNHIICNNVTNNGNWGIAVCDASNYNIIRNNSATNNDNSGIGLASSTNNIASGNNVTNNMLGVALSSSSNNDIVRNNILLCTYGIYLFESSNNNISGNSIKANQDGIRLQYSSNYNIVTGNNFTNNVYAIGSHSKMFSYPKDNRIYHNNFLYNSYPIHAGGDFENIWDNGYPSGGNYWSDYEDRYPDANELDNSGVWDTPYVIDESNQDSYPLVHIIPEFPSFLILPLFMITTLLAFILYKRKHSM